MRAECFKTYTQCVVSSEYFAIAHDLDCAVNLVGCVGEGTGLWRTATSGERVQNEERVRAVLQRHTDELKQHNQRVRDLGPAASDDESLMRDFDKFLDKIGRELERQQR
jgi:hypothetical protein